jgi:hypothetical protein
MGGKSNSNKGTDRARNYAVDIAQQTDPIWQNMIAQGTKATSANYDPTQNSVFQWAQNQLGSTVNPQATADTDIYKQLQGLYAPWQSTDYQNSPLYTQMNDLYTQQAQPLYDQMLDPLKRNLEGQYQTSMNQIMAGVPRGGAMASAMGNAASQRAMGVSDLEKQLRTQDILRQDTINQQRTGALANVLSGLEQTRQNVAGQLGAGALSINQQNQSNQLAGNQLLTALLSNLYSQDQSAASQLGLYGKNSLQGILNQQSAGAQQASAQGGSDLMSMMSQLGLGAGMLGSSMFGSGTKTAAK